MVTVTVVWWRRPILSVSFLIIMFMVPVILMVPVTVVGWHRQIYTLVI
jgi:hypothetical protein